MAEIAAEGPPIYTVSEVLAGVRGLLEERVGRLWVVGEVTDLRRARSGHSYFSLEHDKARLRAVLFAGSARRLAFEPEDGLEVLAYGELTLYEPRGDLQLIVRQLEPRGQGALQLAFEQLRRVLEAEGLFDPARKRPLPPLPQSVGVVTSPSGAALRDVLEVSGRRFPAARILLAPTRVQGVGAEDEIADALAALSDSGEVDLALLVRGGGSLEDLRPFNTERVARAIVASRVPVISGVGHEVDVTIADLAADLRAPTPSAAAELALPDREELRAALESRWLRLVAAARALASRTVQRLERDRGALRANAPSARLAAQRARLLAASRALERAIEANRSRAGARFEKLAARLDGLSPLAVLGRGYAIARRARDGAIVRSAEQLEPGEKLAVRVAEAELEVSLRVARALLRS